MSLKLTDFVLRDFVYKQNPDHSYVLDKTGDFILEDRNAIIDAVLTTLEKIYTNIIVVNKVNPGKIECNEYLLDKAFSRYSRDVFGELRFQARIDNLQRLGRITNEQGNQLSRFYDYGLKIDSRSPYVHRQLSVFLYWLAVLKPFTLYPDKNTPVNRLGVAFEFHNEYVSYLLCLSFLKVFNYSFNIHTHKDGFYDFLYDLHFRNLSRSSLEFFLGEHIRKIKTNHPPAAGEH
jgi:hypothetical protein